jgi:hypothetical protein
MYSDDTCSNYVGDAADAADYTQQTFDDAELQNYYDTDCISCNAEQAFGLISDSDYGATSDGSPPGNPLCPALYDASAKCNIHMAESYSGVDQDGNEYWSVGVSATTIRQLYSMLRSSAVCRLTRFSFYHSTVGGTRGERRDGLYVHRKSH